MVVGLSLGFVVLLIAGAVTVWGRTTAVGAVAWFTAGALLAGTVAGTIAINVTTGLAQGAQSAVNSVSHAGGTPSHRSHP